MQLGGDPAKTFGNHWLTVTSKQVWIFLCDLFIYLFFTPYFFGKSLSGHLLRSIVMQLLTF